MQTDTPGDQEPLPDAELEQHIQQLIRASVDTERLQRAVQDSVARLAPGAQEDSPPLFRVAAPPKDGGHQR